VVDAALDVDGELAVAGDHHGRVGDLAPGLFGRLGRGVDVLRHDLEIMDLHVFVPSFEALIQPPVRARP